MKSKKRIIVMGFMASCPIAGVVWQHLHYLIGAHRLGHEVYYIEDSARIPYNPATFEVSEDYSYAAATLARLFEKHHLGAENWAFCARYLPGHPTAGMSFEKIKELYRTADAIFNVCGSQEFNDELLASERLLYIESDPAVEQIKLAKGTESTRAYLARHHALFSFGENLNQPDCGVPHTDFQWHPTRQPVVTGLWKMPEQFAFDSARAVYTTIANWATGGKKDIEWNGQTYLWSKNPEFHKFIQAPAVCGETFELATDMKDPAERGQFAQAGWRFTLPHKMSEDFDLYRQYIWGSKGEFTVAKDQYTRLNTGWFSDRSACYLAAGKPVITQETGFGKFIPSGLGLFSFRTLDDIREAAAQIAADYPRHSQAAAQIAREYFEAEKVVADILEKAGA
ncbi:hypothetical protein QPK87_15835 [Kamptonema cortianum]|nr:hypothetical protein [Oscillatoria laete-virens]MDK3158030.1 hypothetical protein [Kamptonema cortianum]MDL5048203.1 hypothetical protein [Oscillatoria amoena NRMC-F 0135]MDL5053096.1 hypothetical protein [Oscillatoria laete-virens NRMC-F 0139]